MTRAEEPGLALLRVLADTARGPKRDAAFALWLTVRVAEDMMTATDLTERAQRRRVVALEKRVSSLSLAPSFRRALTETLVLWLWLIRLLRFLSLMLPTIPAVKGQPTTIPLT